MPCWRYKKWQLGSTVYQLCWLVFTYGLTRIGINSKQNVKVMVVSFPIFYYFFFTTTRVLDQSGRIVGGVVIKIYLNRGVPPHGRSTDLPRKTKPSTLMAIQPAWNCWDFEINEVGLFDSLWTIQKEGSYASSKHPIQINFWWSFHWWHCSRLKLCFFLTEKRVPPRIFRLPLYRR